MMRNVRTYGILLGCWLLLGCSRQVSGEAVAYRDLTDIREAGVLRVVTLSGPISYFSYKDVDMGYEYEFAQHLCEELGVEMMLRVVGTTQELVAQIAEGQADLIAYRLPCTAENKEKVLFTERSYVANQVIVQCKSDSMAKTVFDLNGREVFVVPGSIYEERIQHLSDETGGGIVVREAPDSMNVDDLIAQTAHGTVPMTVADYDLARVNKTYFGNLDYSLEISFPQRSAWAVSKEAPELAAYINRWTRNTKGKLYFSAIYNKYFERSKYFESVGLARIHTGSRISSFDDLFRKYAPTAGWDWRLLAAVAYKESKFDPQVVSWAGACGLMQLMPSTARSLGLTDDDFHNPESSIKAGALYIRKMDRLFPGIDDPEQRAKFVLAAYNSGPGHVFDARALALKHEKNPDVWDDVAPFLLLKAEPEYYNDEVCKYGYCRGSETVDYVDVVWRKFQDYKSWVKR
ncbi:MAG: transglycosylase SLT domain-containing protein [Paludibacteraceae bacterium]|nr:transglycosylase SLT domain-containing protein [Paludibacteraceae bacterium]